MKLEKVSFVGRHLMGWTTIDSKKTIIVTSEIKKYLYNDAVLNAISEDGSMFQIISFDSATKKEVHAIKNSILKAREKKMVGFLQNIVKKVPEILIATDGWFSEHEALLTLSNGEKIYSEEIVSYDSDERILTAKHKKKEKRIFLSQSVWIF